jgi:hypothetical protein
LSEYRRATGAETIKGFDPKMMSFETLPGMAMIAEFNAIKEVNLDSKTGVATVDLQVDPGKTLTLKVVGPDGKPLGGIKVSGTTDLFAGIAYLQDSAMVQVRGLDGTKPRRVTVTQEGRKLVGSMYLKGDETGERTLRLEPWGELVGRVVDEYGQPVKGLQVAAKRGTFPGPLIDQEQLPGTNQAPGIVTDGEGRFRATGLVPGLKYGGQGIDDSKMIGFVGFLFSDVRVSPGEVKDLGDLKPVRNEKEFE